MSSEKTTLKDPKENPNHPTTTLINPVKSKFGRMSKLIYYIIDIMLFWKLKLNDWKKTNDVINWIEKKGNIYICFPHLT